MSKRIGLPVTLKMRHDSHYVETLTSYSGAAVGRMIPAEKIRPNPDQPRKALGDLHELTESIKEKGVLEPLLVRYVPREECYYIISGERRYHAARAAGLRELPCIEKIADDAETLELALIENIQRKDLTPFEEALRNIPDHIRKKCMENGILSKSLLLQIARRPTEKKMLEMVHRILQGGLTRDDARRERRDESSTAPRPQPFVFNFQPENDSFRLRVQFRKSHVSREELIATLREILASLERSSVESAGHAVA